MRKILIAIALLGVVSCSCENNDKIKPLLPSDKEQPSSQSGAAWEISKGVNIGNYLSQSTARGQERAAKFTRSDVQKLASYGFDHLRLPVDEEHLFTSDGNFDPEGLALVHNVIGWCKDAGMKVLFDMHDLKSHKCVNDGNTFWDVPAEQDKLVDHWTKILSELEKYPTDLVAYEMMNEPIAPTARDWNVLANRIIRLIRSKNADRTIVFGANRWEIPSEIPNLDVPEGDKNIILEFHYYQPMLLTHYKASWDKFANLDLKYPLTYPGLLVSDELYNSLSSSDKALVEEFRKDFSKQTIASAWSSAIKFAAKKGLRLYLGEFGCLPYCGEQNRINWTSDMVSLCKENGIAYCYWEYNSEFGFARQGTGEITNSKLLEVLSK